MARWIMYLVKTRHENFSLDTVYCFLKIITFFEENFSTSFQSYQPILENVTIKFGGEGGEVEAEGPRAEKNKYLCFTT